MASAQDFVDACAAASDALTSLSYEASALEVAATDDQDVNIAQQAKRFADRAGPIALQRAKTKGDPQELALLQRGLAGVTTDVTDALTTDLVERFLAFPLAGILALAPAEVLDQAREDLASLPTPPGIDPGSGLVDIPWPVALGVGAVAGGALALVSSGSPKAAIAGAAGGALLGALVKTALTKLGSAFSFGGFGGSK